MTQSLDLFSAAAVPAFLGSDLLSKEPSQPAAPISLGGLRGGNCNGHMLDFRTMPGGKRYLSWRGSFLKTTRGGIDPTGSSKHMSVPGQTPSWELSGGLSGAWLWVGRIPAAGVPTPWRGSRTLPWVGALLLHLSRCLWPLQGEPEGGEEQTLPFLLMKPFATTTVTLAKRQGRGGPGPTSQTAFLLWERSESNMLDSNSRFLSTCF